MGRVSIGLAGLCLFAALAGCSVDRSHLGAPPSNDAAAGLDTVVSSNDSGGTGQGAGGLTSSADALASTGRGGSGGSGGGATGGNTGAGGSPYVGSTGGANLAVDAAGTGGGKGDGALDRASEVADDSAPTRNDSGGTDHARDSMESGGGADGPAAALDVGADDVRNLGTDAHETGGKDQGDAGCLSDGCVPFIVPSFPAAMKCNLDGSTAELNWSDFSTWEPAHDSHLCGNAGAYYVQGTVAQFRPGLQVLAEVYAPEDSTWHPISGGPIVQPDAAGGFDGYFCLPQNRLERTFRFRIVQANTTQDAGLACLMHLSRP